MKVKQSKLNDGRVQLGVVATAEEVDHAFDLAEGSFARSLGLRPDPDKSARQAIAEKMKIRDVDSVVSGQAFDMLVPYAIDKSGLIPQLQPDRSSQDALKRGKSYTFTLIVTPKPTYKLSSYDPVEITVPPFVFDDSQVDSQIEQMVQSYPSYTPIPPRPLRAGDNCTIAVEVTQNGKRLDSICTEGRPYSTDQGFMPGSFDENIYGMEPGETRTFDFEAPDFDEQNNQILSTFTATVTLKELQEKSAPEITDEWLALNMPMYKSVDDLRESIASSLKTQQRQQYDLQVSMAVTQKLGDRLVGKIPDEVYEQTAQSMVQTLHMQLQQQGKDYDEFVQEQGGEQNFNMGLMMQVGETLHRDYALDAIFEHESLSISDQDIRDACSEIDPYNPMNVQREMESQGRGFALNEVAARIAANKWAVEHAKITVQEQNAE